MDEETVKANMDTLKELILDDERLVTYVSLSKELCIHVNDSKILMTRLVDEIKKKQPKLTLNVNYIVSGLYEDNKARTIVCREEELDSKKSQFKTVFFDHIYSLSKVLNGVDVAAFTALNKFEDFVLCSGQIKSSECKKHTSDEIGNLKSSSQNGAVTEQKPVTPAPKKVKEEKQANKKEDKKLSNVVTVHETKSEPIVKTEAVSPKKDLSIKQKSLSSGSKPQKGIAGFFNKANGSQKKPADKEIKVKEKPVAVKVEKNNSVEEMDVDIETSKIEKPVIKKEQIKETKKTNIKKETNKNKSLDEIKKTAKLDKKRKRVLHVSDSESDNEDPFVAAEPEPDINNESEDEIPPTPTVNTVKITSGIVNPKKKRKIVDKTYTDEEGYILTKKVEIYESCSDNEDEAVAKENVKVENKVKEEVKVKTEVSPKEKQNGIKNGKKKISPPQKGKQANLMSFFKRSN